MKAESTKQYMFLVRGKGCGGSELSPEEMQAKMTEVYEWIENLTRKGIFSAAQPLTPEGKLLSAKGGRIVTDDIAAESKEAVGGFFIVNVATMDEAVRIAESSPMFKYGGQLEVRQISQLTRD